MRRIEKDDPGIPLAEVYVRANLSEDGICWSCQAMLPSNVMPLTLDRHVLLPVCLACWAELTVAERLGFAIQFKASQ